MDEEPTNELYQKSLEVGAKSSKKKRGDLKYDIFGCVILAIGIVAWTGMAKSHFPPPPAR